MNFVGVNDRLYRGFYGIMYILRILSFGKQLKRPLDKNQMNWTVDQILALAPDSQSAKAGNQLATLRKWDRLGRNQQSIWGECQGSGEKPYQTRIDLSEPAFQCSCPSRKFPCKHALGLWLLAAQQPDS